MKSIVLFLLGMLIACGCENEKRKVLITDIELYSIQHTCCRPDKLNPAEQPEQLKKAVDAYASLVKYDSRDGKLLCQLSSSLENYIFYVGLECDRYKARIKDGVDWAESDNDELKKLAAGSRSGAANIARLMRLD